MILHYREYGSGSPVILLHGFLGSSDNWHSIAKRLSPRFRVLAVDQRNHGKSPWREGMDYPSMAEEVIELMDSEGMATAALVGHSMGGKTAMEAALARPERLSSLVIVDIAPIPYSPRYLGMIDALLGLDISAVRKRSEADALLADRIPDRMLRLFLLKNLERTGDDGFRWRINLPGIRADYDAVWAGLEGGRTYPGPALFIAGGKGGYLEKKDADPVLRLFPAARFVTFENAGHWVHVDEPEEFAAAVMDFLAG